MQNTPKSCHVPYTTQRSKAAPKVNLLLLTKNPRKINLDSLPLISPMFFGFLLINAFLKLHYKNISTSAHLRTATPSETMDLLATLLMV